MTPNDYLTILGGLGWLVILIIRQHVAIRNSVIRSHDNQKANP
jgi:hypothetical protein